MVLPRPPISLNTPIPNQPFSSEEVYYLEGNQGHLPLGNGLYIDPATGEFTNVEPSPYIYCTPQYGNLPVSYPPYSCETAVNTAGVTDFTNAWASCGLITDFPCVNSQTVSDFSQAWIGCTGLTSFPLLDVNSGTNFSNAWASCTSLTSFPLLNVSSGTNFYGAWYTCTSLTYFPRLDVSSGTNFSYAWSFCESLTYFPALDLSLGEEFEEAWFGCTNLALFPAGVFDTCSATNFAFAWGSCALSQQSVDNILVSLDTAGQSNGVVNIDGGTSSSPGPSGLAAKASLEAKGWSVITN